VKAQDKKQLEALNAKKLNEKETDSRESDDVKPQEFTARDAHDEEDAGIEVLAEPSLLEQIKIRMHEDAVSAFKEEKDAMDSQIEALREELEATKASLEQQQKDAKDAIERKTAETKQILELFASGTKLPLSNTDSKSTPYITGGSLNRYHDADLLKEFNSIRDQSNGFTVYTPSGDTVTHKDTRQSDKFYSEHRDSILRAVERDMQKHGFLRGGIASRDNTTPGDIPYAFLDVASAEGRMTHHEETIFWQFARRLVDPSLSVEQTGRFPRLELGAVGSTPSDYILGSSVPALQTTTEALRASSVPIEIKELGLGRPGTALQPISISEIITSNSIFDALGAINTRLVKSYNRAEDFFIRSLFGTTTRGGYISNDGLVETAGEVAGGGQITQKFLSNLYGVMSALQIPKLNGRYMLVLPPQVLAALRQDLIDRQRFIDPSNEAQVTNIFREYYGDANLKRVSGYQGEIEHFYVFESNAYGAGVDGTEGVQTETLNGASVLTRNCYAFGVDAVGVLESMPFTIRSRGENSFGRTTDFIWLAHQGYGALDIDPLRTRAAFESPGDTASEQLRVLEIKSADIAV